VNLFDAISKDCSKSREDLLDIMPQFKVLPLEVKIAAPNKE